MGAGVCGGREAVGSSGDSERQCAGVGCRGRRLVARGTWPAPLDSGWPRFTLARGCRNDEWRLVDWEGGWWRAGGCRFLGGLGTTEDGGWRGPSGDSRQALANGPYIVGLAVVGGPRAAGFRLAPGSRWRVNAGMTVGVGCRVRRLVASGRLWIPRGTRNDREAGRCDWNDSVRGARGPSAGSGRTGDGACSGFRAGSARG